jgi:KUP system potassium uptake protein
MQVQPFYAMMPHWFLYFGIAIATTAAIIASQALISGSFTLISEAMRLNLWPKLRINYPTEARGQLFVAGINFFTVCRLYRYCSLFPESFQYGGLLTGLRYTLCMIATSILFANFLVLQRTRSVFIYIYLLVFLTIELSFLFCQYPEIPAWRLCCIVCRRDPVPHYVCMVPGPEDQKPVCGIRQA